MSGNRRQYSGQTFADFTAAYGFKHITSSPKFPQSNGEAEGAVQTEKKQLIHIELFLPIKLHHCTTSANHIADTSIAAGADTAGRRTACSKGKGEKKYSVFV